MTDRKQLLLEAEKTVTQDEQVKLAAIIDEGMSLRGLTESRGWKIVYERFIRPNMSEDRWLDAPRGEADDVRVEVRTLKKLMSFINTRIAAAQDAANKLPKGE